MTEVLPRRVSSGSFHAGALVGDSRPLGSFGGKWSGGVK